MRDAVDATSAQLQQRSRPVEHKALAAGLFEAQRVRFWPAADHGPFYPLRRLRVRPLGREASGRLNSCQPIAECGGGSLPIVGEYESVHAGSMTRPKMPERRH
jgi:hypothetical protein